MQKIRCIYFVYILYLPLQRTVALIYVYILFNALTTAVLGATNRAQQYEWIMQYFLSDYSCARPYTRSCQQSLKPKLSCRTDVGL